MQYRLNPESRDSERLWGVSLDDLQGPDLYLVPEKFRETPDYNVDLGKLLPYEKRINRHYGIEGPGGEIRSVFSDSKKLKEISRYLPYEPFWSEFTFDEISRIYFSDFIQSKLTKLFDRGAYETTSRDHPEEREMPEYLEFVYKLKSSMWQYGYRNNWNSLVMAYYAIPEFRFGGGFDVRFDHSSYFNPRGWAYHVKKQILEIVRGMSQEEKETYWENNNLYLDGVFSYLIYYKGRHVLTIGFSLGEDCIYLSQIQVRNKKGNRWLYKIPGGYFNYTVRAVVDHFNNFGLDVYLVDSKSLADHIASAYGDDQELDPSAYQRIIKSYAEPIDLYRRGPVQHQRGMDYYELLPYRKNPVLPT